MSRARMNRYHVGLRLRWNKRTKGQSPVRDIAWAQLCAPDLLEKYKISPLTTQQLSIVEQIYKRQGGLAEAEYVYLHDGQIVKGKSGIWSIRNEEYYGAPETAESQEVQEPPMKKVKVEDDEEDAKKEYTPNRGLQAKYGVLDVDYDEPVLVEEESPGIPADQIPIGIFRDDPAPARLITATIDPADQNIQYTVQPNDRNFVKVRLHEGHLVENGTSWSSEGDAAKDSETILFLRMLQDKDYDELRRYVFQELRREGQFENLWTSFEDMLEHPGLLLMAQMIRDFSSGGRASGLSPEDGAQEASQALSKAADVLRELGSKADDIQKLILYGPGALSGHEHSISGEKADARRQMEGLWGALGQAWQAMLALRRD